MKKIIEIIELMQKEKVSPKEFITNHYEYFSDIPIGSIIAPECRYIDKYSEKSYIFLVGSYIYFRTQNEPITWFERRRFSENEELFKRTLCSNPNERTVSLDELKKFLKIK